MRDEAQRVWFQILIHGREHGAPHAGDAGARSAARLRRRASFLKPGRHGASPAAHARCVVTFPRRRGKAAAQPEHLRPRMGRHLRRRRPRKRVRHTRLSLLRAVSWLTDQGHVRIVDQAQSQTRSARCHSTLQSPASPRHPAACGGGRRCWCCWVLLAATLAPGLIANDRPFQVSLCDDLEQTSPPCAPLEPTISAAMDADGPALAQPGQVR